jgi:transposase
MNRWVVGLRRPGHGTASNILYSNRKLYIFHESAMTEDVMAPYRRLTHSERARIHTLRYTTGWPCTRISRELQIPYETVRRCTHEPITPTKPRGRPPLLNTPLRQRLISHATSSHEQRLKPWAEIAHELGINVDQRTLTKAFHQEGYYRRVATEKPLLTPKHINDRLWWAATCQSWPGSVWSRVIWSDEASFRVGRGKVYVTRRPEEKYLPSCCVPKFKDYSCVHVWACIGRDGSKGPLFVWDREKIGNINSASYVAHILPLIQSFKMEHEIFRVGISNALLMQDGASSHTARATKQALHERAIRLLWWPANSPDLNPIENVWRLLKSRVQRRFPTTKQELITAIKEEWEIINVRDIQKYCTNMGERCQAVLQARGGHTPF